MLPGVNGYRLCAELRRRGDWTPILMLTAKDGDEDVHEWLMDRFTAIDASGPWWLGARTLDGNHANFAWRDGTKLGPFTAWAGCSTCTRSRV